MTLTIPSDEGGRQGIDRDGKVMMMMVMMIIKHDHECNHKSQT